MVFMFFRSAKPAKITFPERLDQLRQAGFQVAPEGSRRARVSKGGCAAIIEDADDKVKVGKSGVLVNGELAHLVSGGYQMFLRTESGKMMPAVAEQLKAMHAFDEDVRDIIGDISFYNEGLGTTSEEHLYDRVVARDKGVPPRPWELKGKASLKN